MTEHQNLINAALFRLPTTAEYQGWIGAARRIEDILIVDPPSSMDGRRILIELLHRFTVETTLYALPEKQISE